MADNKRNRHTTQKAGQTALDTSRHAQGNQTRPAPHALGSSQSGCRTRLGMVEIKLPLKDEEISAQTFSFRIRKEKLAEAELFDGHYLLRSNLSDKEPQWLWKLYMLLVQIEAVFRCFKNDLGIRPLYHQNDARVEAHIFVCFQAYCLWVTLQQRLRPLAPGLTPRQALDQLAKVQMLDVEIPTTDGRFCN